MKSRQYCFTENNPDVSKREDFVIKLNAISDAWVFQLEKGEEGTPHYQGWFHIKKGQQRLTYLKKHLSPTAHFEIAKGSRQQNLLYCTKEEGRIDGPWKQGDFSIKSGTRTDLNLVVESIRSKRSISEVANDYPEQFIKYHRGIKELKFQIDKQDKSLRQVEVQVLWGETGTGKTFTAINDNPDYFKLDKANNIWFDGYDGESVLIIDDFYGWLPFGMFLNILDKYPLRLEIKGGFTWAKWTKVVITSNKQWEEWYNNISTNQQEALRRRITNTFQFNK